MPHKNPQTVIFSRTDSIGDVMLTLPMLGIFREEFPDCKIIFLGKKYTKAIADACQNIDEFVDWDEIKNKTKKEKMQFLKSLNADAIIHIFPNREIASIARKARIPLRIGTSHRIYHWLNCNKLLNFTRKNSDLHEAQLNLKLLSPFGITKPYSLIELQKYFGLTQIKPLNEKIQSLLDKNRFNLILHPKSKGHGREWGIENFSELIHLLPESKFKIFVTGTKEEGERIKILAQSPMVTNLTGKLNLHELIAFINQADGFVASGTGPLHLAAALGKKTIGIFPPIRPIHPGRWAPIGKNAHVFVLDKTCSDCRKTKDCQCIRSILPAEIAQKLISFSK